MPLVKDSVRNMQVGSKSGKRVSSTMKLSGEASDTLAERANNTTTQYTTKGPPKGPLGGHNTNS